MGLDHAPAGRSTTTASERILGATRAYKVEGSPQWGALCRQIPGVLYFATDLDPRSFDYDPTDSVWVGRADLLLTAPCELRSGQTLPVSFTLPARVELAELDGIFSVQAFDFCADDGEGIA